MPRAAPGASTKPNRPAAALPHQIAFRADPKLRRAIVSAAKQDGRTMSQWIVVTLTRVLAEQRGR